MKGQRAHGPQRNQYAQGGGAQRGENRVQGEVGMCVTLGGLSLSQEPQGTHEGF